MTQALELSWEQLQLSAAAGRRKQAQLILDLGQLIVAGWGDKDAWREKQRRLIDQLKPGST